jgi:hypothetical protein
MPPIAPPERPDEGGSVLVAVGGEVVVEVVEVRDEVRVVDLEVVGMGRGTFVVIKVPVIVLCG